MAEPFVGDLLEESALRRQTDGRRAGWWLALHTVRSLPALLRLRIERHVSRTGRTGSGLGTRRAALGTVAVTSGAALASVAAFGASALFRRSGGALATPSMAPTPGGSPAYPPLAPTPAPLLPAEPPLALVLVLDRSGSMSATDTESGTKSRMQLAIEGARRAMSAVSVGDVLGVISFDYDARWVVNAKRIGAEGDVRTAEQSIAAIQPDGGTDIYRALQFAYIGLQQVQAQAKHVILLTDGEQGSPAPFPTLVNALQREGVTVSTIGIASRGGAAGTLEFIARLGMGRSYIVHTAAELPDVLASEAHAFVSLVRGSAPARA